MLFFLLDPFCQLRLSRGVTLAGLMRVGRV